MVSGCPFRWLCAHRLGAREPLFESRTIGKDASLLDHLTTVGVQQAQMAVAVADVYAGGNVVVVGHGRSPPSCLVRFGPTIFYVCHRRLRAEHNLGLLIPFGPGLSGLLRILLLGTWVNSPCATLR